MAECSQKTAQHDVRISSDAESTIEVIQSAIHEVPNTDATGERAVAKDDKRDTKSELDEKTCAELNRKPNVTQDGKELRSFKRPSSDIRLTEMCDQPGHTDKLIEYFCLDCDKVICSVCSCTLHRKCESVEYIADASNDSDKIRYINEFDTRYTTVLQVIQNKKAHVREKLALVNKRFDGTITELKLQKEVFDAHMNQLIRKAEEDIENKRTDCRTHLETSNAQFESLLKQMDNLYNVPNEAAAIDDRSNLLQRFIKLKKRMGELEIIESTEKYLQYHDNIPLYDFVVSDQISSIPKVVKDFGQLQTINNVKVCNVQEKNIQSDSDRFPCNITGMTILNSNSIILADHHQSVGNNKLKHINTLKWSLVSSLEPTQPPFDVVAVSGVKVAVTFPDEGFVRFFGLGKSGKLKAVGGGDFNAGLECRGLCYAEEKLVVSYHSPQRKLNVFSIDGQHQKEICFDPNNSYIFKNPFYITFNVIKRLFYVSDYEAGKLVILSPEGKIVSVFKDAEFKCLSGLTSDSDGRVFACTAYPPSMLQIVQSDIQKVAGKDAGLAYPRCILYSNDKKCLYVSMWGSNVILIFEIKEDEENTR